MALLALVSGNSSKPAPPITAERHYTNLMPAPLGRGIDLSNTPQSGIYLVEPGDTLSLIAARFRVSEDALQEINHLADAESVYSGQSLIIPVSKE